MEKECFFSGYCRRIDNSRMVAAVKENSVLLEVDCCYPECPYCPDCVIAHKISAFLKEDEKSW